MAELTHLNEASVVHNLHLRYQADLIYVTLNIPDFVITIYIHIRLTLNVCLRPTPACFW